LLTISLEGDGARESIVLEAPPDGPSSQFEGLRYSLNIRFAVLIDESEARVSGLTLRGARSAIHAGGGGPTIEGLLIDGVGQPHDNGVARDYPNAITVSHGSRAQIRANTLVDSGPIGIHDTSGPLVVDNILIDGASIVSTTASDDAVIRGNTVTGTLNRGIGLFGTGDVLVEGNTVIDAAAEGIGAGVLTSPGTAPRVLDNTVRDSDSASWSCLAGSRWSRATNCTATASASRSDQGRLE
jgi:hypothetical protein